MTIETPAERAEQAAAVLAPESGFLADPDVTGLGRVARGARPTPADTALAWARYGLRLAQIPPAALAGWLGDETAPPARLNPKDRRFADRTWSGNPAFHSLRMSYQAFADLMNELVD